MDEKPTMTREEHRAEIIAGAAAHELRRWPHPSVGREAARRLVALGGSDPDATAGPRRRFG